MINFHWITCLYCDVIIRATTVAERELLLSPAGFASELLVEDENEHLCTVCRLRLEAREWYPGEEYELIEL